MYYNDPRYGRPNGDVTVDHHAMTLSVLTEDDDGLEYTITIMAMYDVCGTCNGKGRYVNPNIDSHGISREEFDEDPDFEEGYFRGDYDVTCVECSGLRVVLVPNNEANDEKLLKEFNDIVDGRIKDDYADRHTRYMESGGYE